MLLLSPFLHCYRCHRSKNVTAIAASKMLLPSTFLCSGTACVKIARHRILGCAIAHGQAFHGSVMVGWLRCNLIGFIGNSTFILLNASQWLAGGRLQGRLAFWKLCARVSIHNCCRSIGVCNFNFQFPFVTRTSPGRIRKRELAGSLCYRLVNCATVRNSVCVTFRSNPLRFHWEME